jgi:hypothetical protein
METKVDDVASRRLDGSDPDSVVDDVVDACPDIIPNTAVSIPAIISIYDHGSIIMETTTGRKRKLVQKVRRNLARQQK